MNADKSVVVYTSSVSGSLKVKNAITRTLFVLKANHIEFEEIDVAADEEAKNFMIATSGKRTIPQVFVDGVFVADAELVEESNEYGDLMETLGL